MTGGRGGNNAIAVVSEINPGGLVQPQDKIVVRFARDVRWIDSVHGSLFNPAVMT